VSTKSPPYAGGGSRPVAASRGDRRVAALGQIKSGRVFDAAAAGDRRVRATPTQSELAPQSVLLARLRRVRPNFGIQHLPVNQDRWPQGQLKEMLLRWTRRERPGSVESDAC
jgi:hypothetical protein